MKKSLQKTPRSKLLRSILLAAMFTIFAVAGFAKWVKNSSLDLGLLSMMIDRNNTTADSAVLAPIHGIVTVGTGGDYTSLTNSGGLFQAINTQGVDGDITALIISDLSNEGGASLFPFAAPFTLKIEASGAARIISGPGNTFLIDLNGADRVTIDGTANGPYGLTFRNTGSGTTLQFESDASDNLIMNTRFESSGANVIQIGDGSVTGNDNNIFSGNLLQNAAGFTPGNLFFSNNQFPSTRSSDNQLIGNTFSNWLANGVYIGGQDENWTIAGNDLSQGVPVTTNHQAGITFGAVAGTNLIENNKVHGIVATNGLTATGISLANGGNLTIARNTIYGFNNTASATGDMNGILYLGSAISTPNVNVVNNFVSISPTVAADFEISGIQNRAFANNTFTADHNTVYIGGMSNGSISTWALRKTNGSQSMHTQRNNIAFNNRIGPNNNFASAATSQGFGTFTSDGNFFAGTGTNAANFMDIDHLTSVSFATWQTGPPPRDANSFAGMAGTFAVASIFMDAAAGDLHLLPTARLPLDNAVLGTGVIVDIDFDSRPQGSASDIGADELIPISTPTATSTSTNTATNTPTRMATNTATNTPTATATFTPTPTPSRTATNTPTNTATTTPTLTLTNTPTATPTGTLLNSPLFDYDGDHLTDASVFRPLSGEWYVNRSHLGVYGGVWGQNGDKIVPADYDGDGKTDIAVYRPSANPGTWYILNSATSTLTAYQFGSAEDIVTPADYDGDRRADISVFRPSNGVWYQQYSFSGQFSSIPFGTFGDRPAASDYDGDGKTDIAVIRNAATPSANLTWYIWKSSTQSLYSEGFGLNGDTGTPADYDGDGKTDISIYRPSTGDWWLHGSSNGNYWGDNHLGDATDMPVPGYYDNDSRADFALFDPSTGHWFVRASLSIFMQFDWGTNGDIPSPSAFIIPFAGGTATPTATPTPTPGECTSPNYFEDGGLERIQNGSNPPVNLVWGSSSTNFGTVFCSSALCGGLPSHNGTWYALFGSTTQTETSTLSQSVLIPVRPHTQTLKFWMRAGETTAPFNASLSILIDGVGVATFAEPSTPESIYTERSVTIPATFADGHFHNVRFEYAQPAVSGASSFLVDDISLDSGCAATRFDFDGDEKTDATVDRPPGMMWYSRSSATNSNYYSYPFGLSTDKLVPADYDGDGRSEIAVFRPQNGTWYIFDAASQTVRSVQFGTAEDIPVPSDYDFDGKEDLAVFRTTTGSWYINGSLNGFMGESWGTAGDVPLAIDYDHDRFRDFFVYRPSNNTWYGYESYTGQVWTVALGVPGDKPVPADYNGDGRDDLAVYSPLIGRWEIQFTASSVSRVFYWGTAEDIPVPADYDGDRKADLAVFRPSTGDWHILDVATGDTTSIHYGQNGDIPIPSVFIH